MRRGWVVNVMTTGLAVLGAAIAGVRLYGVEQTCVQNVTTSVCEGVEKAVHGTCACEGGGGLLQRGRLCHCQCSQWCYMQPVALHVQQVGDLRAKHVCVHAHSGSFHVSCI